MGDTADVFSGSRPTPTAPSFAMMRDAKMAMSLNPSLYYNATFAFLFTLHSIKIDYSIHDDDLFLSWTPA